MLIISDKISLLELKQITKERFGDFIKVVVDIENELMAIDAELHADEESLLLQNGSNQSGLWGINIYPGMSGNDFIEFDSLINIKPSQGNRSRYIDNETIRNKIIEIVNRLISIE